MFDDNFEKAVEGAIIQRSSAGNVYLELWYNRCVRIRKALMVGGGQSGTHYISQSAVVCTTFYTGPRVREFDTLQ